jgi:beta-lactamase superfamily II metal-dependent hydrolase
MDASRAERGRLGPLAAAVRAGGGQIRIARAGETVYEEHGVKIECLHPSDGASASANDSSLLRARFGHRVLLFTGEIEARRKTPSARNSRPSR